jgi:hypothetical protein
VPMRGDVKCIRSPQRPVVARFCAKYLATIVAVLVVQAIFNKLLGRGSAPLPYECMRIRRLTARLRARLGMSLILQEHSRLTAPFGRGSGSGMWVFGGLAGFAASVKSWLIEADACPIRCTATLQFGRAALCR